MGRSKRPLQDQVALKVKRVGNAVIVLVSGDLARLTTERFEGTLREAIDGRKLDVVLELGDVRFIDSTGLRSLLRIANQCRGAGHKLRLHRPSAPVRQAIAWAGLQRQLPLVV